MFYRSNQPDQPTKILIATLPMTGHVNMILPVVKELIKRKCTIVWYSGKKFKDVIEKAGVIFKPFRLAADWDENNPEECFPGISKCVGFKQVKYYLKNVFISQMKNQYYDLKNIMKTYKADLLLTDLEFTGAIPFAEKKVLPWVILCVHPILYFTNEVIPNIGIANTKYKKGRNLIINKYILKYYFRFFNKKLNKIRSELSLIPDNNFIFNRSLDISDLFMSLSTNSLEYNRKDLPLHVKLIGPTYKSISVANKSFKHKYLNRNNLVILITQGTIDCNNIEKLIIPSLKALSKNKLTFIIITRNKNFQIIKNQFPDENLIIKNYIAYEEIMPSVDIMITNGGFGGVLTALSSGVPMIIAGNTEEKPEIAARISWTGAGINLKTGNPKARHIKKAVKKISTNKKYKNSAMELKKEIAQTNAPSEAADYIDTLIKSNANNNEKNIINKHKYRKISISGTPLRNKYSGRFYKRQV